MDLDRLSLNSMTVPSLSLDGLIDAAVSRGIPAVAPWRHLVDGGSGRRLAAAGLRVTSLCRGGMFTAPDPAGRAAAIADNRRAIDEAAQVGADCLVIVCGPVVGKDVHGSYGMVRDGLGAVLEHAGAAGVRLGIEPLHPMMAADRSVVATMRDAHDLVGELGGDAQLGVIIDLYHVWWDRELLRYAELLRDRILGVHVSDWVTPLTGAVSQGRGMLGDGVIDLPGLVGALPWNGYLEVEVLSESLWRQPVEDTLDLVLTRFRNNV